ncbi:protein S40-4-like [Typha latifolia]|uniref:protein S40-4-like n=1 Tax=Typha latifolia TaxID=4733 RepID=UPI003C2BA3A3
MAGRNRQATTHAYRFFAPTPDSAAPAHPDSDEFDESDVWGYPVDQVQAEPRKPIPSRSGRKKPEKVDRGTAPASLPVNVPDWSKILRGEYRGNSGSNSAWEAEEEGGEGTGMVIPPHELLWKNRAASFSVHEGIGRTLKGRDLSRVRNAIWEKTGFQD